MQNLVLIIIVALLIALGMGMMSTERVEMRDCHMNILGGWHGCTVSEVCYKRGWVAQMFHSPTDIYDHCESVPTYSVK
jgi:hypothetical protein